MNKNLFKSLLLTLNVFLVISYAERGDLFLDAAIVTDPFLENGPGVGGNLGLELGFNDRTDFQLNTDMVWTPKYFQDDGILQGKFYFTSFYTPFFGDIRPRVGGSFGAEYYRDIPDDIEEVLINLGFHAQALAEVSDIVRLFGEVYPTWHLGPEGYFSIPLKVGIQFRLSD